MHNKTEKEIIMLVDVTITPDFELEGGFKNLKIEFEWNMRTSHAVEEAAKHLEQTAALLRRLAKENREANLRHAVGKKA